MSGFWLFFYFVLIIFLAGCQPPETAADKASSQTEQSLLTAKAEESGSEDKKPPAGPDIELQNVLDEDTLSKQLKINRDALLKGSDEQIRVDAAAVMLFSPEPPARAILLDALRQTENKAARQAVCKALHQSRTSKQTIKNKGDFIEPLIDILKTEQDSTQVKLAAEATLIFDYDRLEEQFDLLTTDKTLPAAARVNAVYALKLQPDMRAIVRLIRLLDGPDEQVVAEAEQAIHSMGIPVGRDKITRNQIIKELGRKGRDEFLRDWVIRQEAQLRQLESQVQLWQNLYLEALARIYENIAEDADRAKFLAEYLVDSKAAVRLWALEKVYQGRVGTASKLPAELGHVLINLISDPDRDVRLMTAKLLSLMVQLNSSRKLLQQLEVETDEDLKLQFLIALGGACHYAFSPNSEIRIPEQIRDKTLEWASKYLSKDEPAAAQAGAEVIKKLLEQEGLASGEVDGYLNQLAERYNRQKSESPAGPLAGELLNAMADLCARSAYKQQAVRKFAPLFEQALSDESDLVRQAAVNGFIYVDKIKALKSFRIVLVNDTNPAIRQKLIELAGEVGTAEDLPWLAEKNSSAAAEKAWQAMLKIFRRCRIDVISDWINRFENVNGKLSVSSQQKTSFLELAEQKAVSAGNAALLKDIRTKLSYLYLKQEKYEQAAQYLSLLGEETAEEKEKQQLLAALLDVYLRWEKPKLAADLVHNCLLQKQLDPNGPIVHRIDEHFSRGTASAGPNKFFQALRSIDSKDTDEWTNLLNRWERLLNPDKGPKSPNPD